jgi:hypothetical protein
METGKFVLCQLMGDSIRRRAMEVLVKSLLSFSKGYFFSVLIGIWFRAEDCGPPQIFHISERDIVLLSNREKKFKI